MDILKKLFNVDNVNELKVGDLVEYEVQRTCSDQYGTWNIGTEKKQGHIVKIHPDNKKRFEVEYFPGQTVRVKNCTLVHSTTKSEAVVKSMLSDPDYSEYLKLKEKFSDFERYLKLKQKYGDI